MLLLRLICFLFFIVLILVELFLTPRPYTTGPHLQGGLRLIFYIYLLVIIDRLSRRIERLEDAKIDQLGKRISLQIEEDELKMKMRKIAFQHPQHWKEGWKEISQLKDKE